MEDFCHKKVETGLTLIVLVKVKKKLLEELNSGTSSKYLTNKQLLIAENFRMVSPKNCIVL